MLTPFIKGALSVGELSLCIRQLMRDAFPFVTVYGEISNLRTAKGITWFTLKDTTSQIPVVLFQADHSSLQQPLENGQSVLVEGRIDVYIASGRYQLVAKKIRKLGVGELQRQFEILKEKLRNEGFFSPEKKLPFPNLPKHIGIITSPEAAALQDFLQILKRKNWKGSLLLASSLVQGNGAPSAIMKAFRQLQRRSEIELIVLIRGGGSFEDLDCFNHEGLVRFLAQRRKPLLTGIGHETDYTLCDFVADKRAETPTAAAEILANAYQNALQQRQNNLQRLRRAFEFRYQNFRQRCSAAEMSLKRFCPSRLIEQQRQRYLRLSKDFDNACRQQLQTKQYAFDKIRSRIQAVPLAFCIREHRKTLKTATEHLQRCFRQTYDLHTQRIDQLSQRLQSFSVERQLKRGFLVPLADDGCTLKNFSPSSEDPQYIRHKSGTCRIKIVK